MKNIVLIGIMGSGKSSFAIELSKKLQMQMIDTDDIIIKKMQQPITDIFKNLGEKKFREIESDVIKDVSKYENHIIATGGGVVLDEINMQNLQKNGIIIFIDRSVTDIVKSLETDEVSARPLLQTGKQKLFDVYNKRINLYKKFASIIINNDKDFDEVLENIIKQIHLKKIE